MGSITLYQSEQLSSPHSFHATVLCTAETHSAKWSCESVRCSAELTTLESLEIDYRVLSKGEDYPNFDCFIVLFLFLLYPYHSFFKCFFPP